jgi:undecaprenyl-diphosphatase
MTLETMKVAVLAVLQGITEILPVSSSGHLVLGKTLLRLDSPGATLEAMLHGGTLLAILVYYRARLIELFVDFFRNRGTARRDVAVLFIGFLPAALAAVLFKDRIEESFNSPRLVGFCLMGTGLILLLPRLLKPDSRPGRLSKRQAIVVGLAQIAALLPGISRSGTTITAGRLVGAEGRESAQFSFLMAIPLLAGALGMTLKDLADSGVAPMISWGDMAMGFVVAAITGYLAMMALNRLLATNHLWWFGPYCLLAGLLTIVFATGTP